MMETLGLYLAKSAALMGMFLLAYHLFLKRETFFKSNRWYLLLGLVTSIALPLVTFKKVVWIEVAKPVLPVERLQDAAYASLAETDVVNVISEASQPTFEIDWLLISGVLYGLVALFLAVQFARDFFSLRKLLKGKTVHRRSGYKFVDVPENVAPFSYFDYIVYNSTMFSHDELINVLEHEKVHSVQKHTLDVLFSRILCIAFWWNPIVWYYKKAIIQNLEFIADNEAAKKIPDIKAYQFTLLKITTHENCVQITNHFFQSLIKKRIVMLNKNQSSKWNSYKYLLIVPALAAFFFAFQVKVIAQEKHADALFFSGAQQGVEVVVTKNTTDAELKQQAEEVKKNHGIKLKFSKVKRNSAGEIVAIKAEFKDEFGKKGTTMVSGDKAIEPIRFFKNGNNVGFGKSGYANVVRGLNINRSSNGKPAVFGYTNGNGTENIAIGEPFEFDADSSDENRIVVKSIKNGRQKVIVNGKVISDVKIGDENFDGDSEDVVVSSYGNGSVNGNSLYINGEKIFDNEDITAWTSQGLAEAEKALAGVDWESAKADMARAKADIAIARSDAKRAADVKRDNSLTIVKGHRIERGEEQRAELEKMRAELAKTRAEMDKTRAEMEKIRAEMRRERNASAKKK
ncbi:M56 family metallopeptidase [Flavobacterium sp.]|uniref:M56 family metallopeptidase n=1 Tax=Flavobacterium sp. TaxID=239 RepID=UPI0011FF2D07|nr:M56 family metallopeptidase [Flavobacterium sp.]RZJ71061.1 MAG: M56 family peptidase [Flavobacterium sp.]